jgi:hypothetical protein
MHVYAFVVSSGSSVRILYPREFMIPGKISKVR